MGEFSDYLKKNNLSPELVNAVGTAEDIYGTMSGLYAYYGAAHELGEKLGLFESNNAFDRLQAAIIALTKVISDGFRAVLDGQNRSNQQTKIDSMIGLEADALGALSLLNSVPPGGTPTETEIQSLTEKTNCDIFLDWSHWTIPYFPQTAHTDPWSAEPLEPPHDGSVYAFALMLPRYLRAISRWVVALAAAYAHPFQKPGPNDAEGYHTNLINHADRLALIHNMIRQAIVTLRIPTADEMLLHPRLPWYLRPSDWQKKVDPHILSQKDGRLYGAVELYSTTDSISSYPEPEPPLPEEHEVIGGPVPLTAYRYKGIDYASFADAYDQYAVDFKAQFYPWFVPRHAAMSLREQKVVYNAVGLGRLWSAMNQLRVMAGEAQLPVTEPEDHSVVRQGVWSLREFALRVREAIESVSGPSVGWPVLTIRTTGSLVGIPAAAVGSLRQVFIDETGRVP